MATAVQKLTGDVNRVKVIQMRLAGKTNEQIAGELGLTESGVRYHTQAWLEQQRPSSEQTEELRQVQAAQIDSLTSTLNQRLESDDYLAVTDRLVKLMDRKARLMGLDLQIGVTVNVLTRESLAELLWSGDAPIEGDAVEVTDGS